MRRKLNDFFDYTREKEFITVYYVGIKILEIDTRYKVYITNSYYNMFRRILWFLRKATAKLIAKGYRDMDRIRILYDKSKYDIKIEDGKEVLVRRPEVILVG